MTTSFEDDDGSSLDFGGQIFLSINWFLLLLSFIIILAIFSTQFVNRVLTNVKGATVTGVATSKGTIIQAILASVSIVFADLITRA